MEKLTYETVIQATPEVVWHTMLEDATYRQWVKAFSPDSYYDGVWEQGKEIKFLDPNMGGTKAILDVVQPHQRILARHVALVDVDGVESTTGEMADTWIGSTEEYILTEYDGMTKLVIVVYTHQDFVDMFNSGWPKALLILKALCEKNSV